MRKWICLCLSLVCMAVSAQDGVYYTSGSMLVPAEQTDIKLSKEVLTITIELGEYASVDAYYEFMNGNAPKQVRMGFEADAPYNTPAKLDHKGLHPYVKDFAVTMNDQPLAYTNAVVAKDFDDEDGPHTIDFKPLDLKEWKAFGEVSDQVIAFQDGTMHNARLDSTVYYAYGYLFEADFQPGKNIVHHTYQYRFSESVGLDFTLPYCLAPAIRWANNRIDDFTLRIIDKRGKGFVLADEIFEGSSFVAKEGECYQLQQLYNGWDFDEEPHLLAAPGSTVEWHAKNFRPTRNMTINSSDQVNTYLSTTFHFTSGMVVLDKDGKLLGRYMGHTGKNYLITEGDDSNFKLVPQKKNQVVEYSAKDGHGSLSVYYPQYKSVNIRKAPNVKAAKLCTITASETSQSSYPCRGKANDTNPNDVYEWFGIQIGDHVGYVRSDLVRWKPE